jgi:hypothetical protein
MLPSPVILAASVEARHGIRRDLHGPDSYGGGQCRRGSTTAARSIGPARERGCQMLSPSLGASQNQSLQSQR